MIKLRQTLLREQATAVDLTARAMVPVRREPSPPPRAVEHGRRAESTEAALLAACEQALGHGRRCALLVCDIDQMAEINEAWGTPVGNRVIDNLRRRLQQHHALRGAQLIAPRHGGCFLIFFDAISDAPALSAQAGELAAALSLPMQIDGLMIGVSTSLGFALSPEHGRQAHMLLQHALLAAKRAKREGGGRAVGFDPHHAKRLREHDTQMARLRMAIDRDEFRVAYQPIIDAQKRACGAEALLRGNGPQDLPIGETIRLLEESGLIIDVGLWVLREACRQAALWQARRPGFSVHVNLSALQLSSASLADDIDSALRRFDLPPQALQLEITESSVLAGGDAVLDNIERLRSLGLRFWIDDFGTGYNGLSYLQQLPISGIKIDRSFVADRGEQPRGEALLAAMVRLAEQLALDVIAEGVETEAQSRRLRALGVQAQQGFLYGEAALAPRFEERFLTP